METTAGIQRWQYGHLVLRIVGGGLLGNIEESQAAFMGELNRWGAEGWELIGVTASGAHSGRVVAYLKRPLPAEA